jgi:hypothetical protein
MNTNRQANSSTQFKKDDTNPFGRSAYKPKKRFRRRAIWLAIVTIVILGLIIIYRSFSAAKETSVQPANTTKKLTPSRLSPKIASRLEAQLRVNEITGMEKIARQDKKQLVELLGQLPKKSAIDTRDWDLSDLSDKQMSLLQQKARSGNKTASSFLDQLGKYRTLKNSIRGFEKNLGIPELVTSGDTHFQIAYNFLITQAGKTDAQARLILQNIPFQEPLFPGFKVWNFWLADGFCTFVTQGTAPLTPEEAALQEKEKALARLNSVSCIIGSYVDLKARKILVGGFLKSTRLGEIAPDQFRIAFDLRSQKYIHISAAALQIKKISQLEIFPREFTVGKDYAVNFGQTGRWAQITILNSNAFRDRRVVIAVE